MSNFQTHILTAEYFNKAANYENPEDKNASNVFVKNLTPQATSKDLYDLFSKFGNIISIKIKKNDQKECLGYGYVNFETKQAAEEAIKTMSNFSFQGKNLHVAFYSKDRTIEEIKEPAIIVKHLPPNV